MRLDRSAPDQDRFYPVHVRLLPGGEPDRVVDQLRTLGARHVQVLDDQLLSAEATDRICAQLQGAVAEPKAAKHLR